LVRKKKIDLVFSYLPKDIILTSLAIGGMVSYHIGGIRNARMSQVKCKALKYIHNLRLSGSISNCHSGKDFFSSQGFDAKKITVIPNGISIDRGLTDHRTGKKIIISSLGRLVEQKDYTTALQSIAYLKTKLKGSGLAIHYNIVGDGPEESTLLNLIQQKDLCQEVSLITDIKDIPKLLQQTDIYLSTSLFEGVSNAIMEAMTLCLPIVATDVGDNKYLVEHQLNGYITKQQDEIGIGNALYDMVVSPELRLSMGVASYYRIRDNFNLDLLLKNYLQYITSLKDAKP
jgi:glycosyltransferase involved in cell wall biosynthesis